MSRQILAILIVGCAAAQTAFGQGCINTVCVGGTMCTLNGSAGSMTTGGGNYTVLVQSLAPVANNAICNRTTSLRVGTGATIQFTATRVNPTVPTASCAWFFSAGKSMGGALTFTCTVDQSDGLPVELMDFSVDE